MLNTIIRFSVKNKLMVALGVLMLVLVGAYQLKKLPLDALPDVTSNQVQVITISPALAAPEVERLITFNIEQAAANIPGITELRSISRFGLSVVTVVFNDATNMYWARQQVAERMQMVRGQIPAAAGDPELAPLTTGLGEVYQYFLRLKPGYENRYTLAELRSMQDWIVRRQLMGTPGVADVSSFGGYLKQYEVAIDPMRLQAMQVSLDDLFGALEANNENSGGSYIEKGPTTQFIRTEGLVKSLEDIEQIVVKKGIGGLPVLVKDVAVVQEGHATRYGALVYEDKGEVAGAVVLMLKGANAGTVVSDVKARIETIKQSLPEGVEIVPFYDRTKVIDRAIETITLNLSEGALIVVFMLVLFLGNFRAGFIVASVIPLAMLFAVCMMNLFGVTGNLMSLGALDFGLIVDGAVIIVEAVLHRLHHPGKGESFAKTSQAQMDGVVQQASGKMMNAAVFGQIIILIVYLPILSLQGIEGKMFRPMAQTVAFALLGAFLLSLTYVPAVTALFIQKKWDGKPNFADRLMNKLKKAYRPALLKALQKPVVVVATAVVLFAGSLMVLTRLGGEFIPELEEGDLALDTRLLAGTSLSHTVETAGKLAGALKAHFPEVERIVTRVGASEIPTDPMPMEMSDVIVLLKPRSEWVSASSYDQLADTMGKVIADFPGLTAGFQFPIQMRFNELISGARQDVVCKLYGEDLDTLAAYAGKISGAIEGIKGIEDMYVETVTGLPQLQVLYNRRAMAAFGINVQDANRMVQAAFAGASAGLVYENERRYDLVVRLQGNRRTDLEDIKSLPLPVEGGGQVPLAQVADVALLEGPNQIQREDARRRIIVSFNVRGRDVESVVKEVQQRIQGQVPFPAGYYVNYGGAFENLEEARARLMIAVPAALLLIFFMLYLAFKKVAPGLIIFSAIPLSAIGGILALWLRDMPFSISAGIGFIALFGVSVLNGIVLITEITRLYQEELNSLEDAIVEGCITRLRPVLMTAAVASFGFLPMAISERAGSEVQRPLATVVIAGLISATLLTLFVLPVLFKWFSMKKKKLHTAVILPLLLLTAQLAGAQTPEQITLQQALQVVHQQHPAIAARLAEEGYQKALTGTAFALPKMLAEADFGQNQGPFADLMVGVSQTFRPLGLAKQQQKWYQLLADRASGATALTRKDLEKAVRYLFAEYYFQAEAAALLQGLDSVAATAAALSQKRQQAGESDKLEAAQFILLHTEVQQGLQAALGAQQRLAMQLGMLLLKNGPVAPAGRWPADPTNGLLLLPDSAALQQHPLLQVSIANEQAARQWVLVEQAQNRPEFSVGINSISVSGWFANRANTNEKFYNMSNRFQSVAVGVQFPLFAKGLKQRVEAARQLAAANSLQTRELQYQLQVQLQELQQRYQLANRQWWQHRQNALPQANLIQAGIQSRLKAGSTGFLEYSTAFQQVQQTRLRHAELRYLLELLLADYQYFTTP